MKIIDATWDPRVNRLLISCECGARLVHPSNRWKVACGECGASGHLADIRARGVTLVEEETSIRFYSTREPYGCFSNFSRHGFELDDHYWKTSEHYFQAMKFEGTEHADSVREAPSPKAAARRWTSARNSRNHDNLLSLISSA